ncbi:hypothetical protein [Sodalis sp.]|uniref:hypothetical protein n=1 Tax=Sodalis sp. (in: enterobacteria) TaxID=1898979 RepID=UPI0038737413
MLILILSVAILKASLISALMATSNAAPALMRDTLYSVIMVVTTSLVGFSLLLVALAQCVADYHLRGAK